MKSIIEFSLKRVVFFNVVFILLMVTGVYSLMTNPVENMPPVDMGEVYITTVYYGASADDIENLISRKIEKALNGIENIEYVRSTSSRNYSTVQVKFIDDTDYRKLYDEIRFKISEVSYQKMLMSLFIPILILRFGCLLSLSILREIYPIVA